MHGEDANRSSRMEMRWNEREEEKDIHDVDIKDKKKKKKMKRECVCDFFFFCRIPFSTTLGACAACLSIAATCVQKERVRRMRCN